MERDRFIGRGVAPIFKNENVTELINRSERIACDKFEKGNGHA